MTQINHIKFLLSLLLIIGGFNSCIDRIDLEIPPGESKLVIEGLITTENKPYQVKISWSEPNLNDRLGENDFQSVGNAEVLIIDDLGNEYQLNLVGLGIYQTIDPSFIGEVGRSYTLKVKIGENEFVSTAEKIKPVSIINDISIGRTTQKYFNENNIELKRYYLDVFLDIENEYDEASKLLIEWENIYEFKTTPDANSGCGSCSTCWGTQYAPSELTEQIAAGKSKYKLKVASILLDPFKFQKKVQIKLKMSSLSDRGYEFWRLIEEQKNNSGSLFDSPVGKIKGNILNVSNPEKEVLGFFGASTTTKENIFLLKHQLPAVLKEINPLDYRFDCTKYPAQKVTNIRPSDW